MSPRRINLSAVVLASAALLVAGCGGGSANPSVAQLPSAARAPPPRAPLPAPARPAPARARRKPQRSRLPAACAPTAYPTSQTPQAGGGFLFHTGAGVDPSSPAFETAQAKCKKFLPPGPGSGPPPSAKTLAHFLTVARCMRLHGVPEFPDPRTTAPSNPRATLGGGGGVISDIEGVIFVFQGTIDHQSPAFTRAAAACAFPLHSH